MDDLIHVLRDYAFHCILEGCYDASSRKEREENARMLGQNMDHLRSVCAPEIVERVEILLDILEGIRAEDMDAAFTCGLRVGLALR